MHREVEGREDNDTRGVGQFNRLDPKCKEDMVRGNVVCSVGLENEKKK